MIRPQRLAGEAAVLAGIIVALAALGPFGSYAVPFHLRLLHWAIYLITGYVFFRPVIAAGGALARQTGFPRPLTIAAACAFGAFPTSLVIVLLSAGDRWRAVSGGTLASAYVQTLIIGATVTIVQLLAKPRQPIVADVPAVEVTPSEPELALPAFLDQMPPHLHGAVLCLENEDHYVRVHTVHGDALILMRMRDAVAQLAGQGERVHRGWWVARDAVAGFTREDRNVRLKLVDGREVPVARAMVAPLREQGWL